MIGGGGLAFIGVVRERGQRAGRHRGGVRRAGGELLRARGGPGFEVVAEVRGGGGSREGAARAGLQPRGRPHRLGGDVDGAALAGHVGDRGGLLEPLRKELQHVMGGVYRTRDGLPVPVGGARSVGFGVPADEAVARAAEFVGGELLRLAGAHRGVGHGARSRIRVGGIGHFPILRHGRGDDPLPVGAGERGVFPAMGGIAHDLAGTGCRRSNHGQRSFIAGIVNNVSNGTVSFRLHQVPRRDAAHRAAQSHFPTS